MFSQKTIIMNYLYAPESVLERQRIYSEVNDALGDGERLELFEDIDVFLEALGRFCNSPEFVILLDVGEENLPNITNLRTLIRDAPLIIMLSDEKANTISKSIDLRPKFLGLMDTDLCKIVPIVKKLMARKVSA